MKNILIFLLGSFTLLKANAQDIDTVLYKANYWVSTKDSSKNTHDSLTLKIGKKYSICYSEWNFQTKIFFEKFIKDTKEQAIKTQHIVLPPDFPKDKFGMEQVIFKLFHQNKIIVTDELINEKYFYEDSLNNFNWEILPDTITINGYLCQKAITYFRGRNYIAWFSEKIPIQNGPLKFGGLPGLIFEITDDKKKFIFSLLNFERSLNNEIMEFKLANITQIDRKKIRELRRILFEDPIGFMNSQGGHIIINSAPVMLNRKYDPMELD